MGIGRTYPQCGIIRTSGALHWLRQRRRQNNQKPSQDNGIIARYQRHVKTCGIIAEENGITSIARPVGIVGAIIPSTNPVATPTNNIINALKCGNAIILSPSPKGAPVCKQLIHYIHSEFAKSRHRQKLSADSSARQSPKPRQAHLMQEVDLLVVTGSRNNVQRAYSSGTPAIGVGVGNVCVIIDESADIKDAATKITASKTFDNATSCSSENSLIVVDAIYDTFMKSLAEQGGCLLTGADAVKLKRTLFSKDGLNRDIIAKDISVVIKKAGLKIENQDNIKFLLIAGRRHRHQLPRIRRKTFISHHIISGKRFCLRHKKPPMLFYVIKGQVILSASTPSIKIAP